MNAHLAHRTGGRLLLRIEDIDPGRSRPEYEAALHEDLAWLGLRFDGAVRRQSEHLGEYAEALDALGRRGLTYACFCTRGEAAARVAAAEAAGESWPRDPDGAPLHACACAALPEAERARRIAMGAPHATRLAMAAALAAARPEPLSWLEWDPGTDRTTRIEADPARWGDVVIGRKDVPASYHLAVTHDDAVQGVTHVVRGADLREATHIHVLLQRLRGLPQPLYHHHGLILDADGRKLSKSIRSTALRSLRAEGVTPEEVRRRVSSVTGDA